jgi:hypothetical protein
MMEGGDATVHSLVQETDSAELRGDVSYLEGRLASDFLGTGPRGVLLNKQQWLAQYASGDLRYLSLRTEELVITLLTRGTALVTGRKETLGVSYQGNRIPLTEFRVVEVYVRQGEADDWRLAALHSIPIIESSHDVDTHLLREVEVKIEKSIEIFADSDRVWEIVSSTVKENEYQGATTGTVVAEGADDTISTKATAGPLQGKKERTVVLDPKRAIRFSFVGDAMRGERSMVFAPIGESGTRVDVLWNIEFSQRPETIVPEFLQAAVKRSISESTDRELERVKQRAESLVSPRYHG